jgi:predicted CoA-binding protein
VLGENAFPDLRHVTGMVDVVDVFRSSEHVPQIVDACIERGVRTLWLQEGVIHHEAAQKAVDAGIEVVMDRCMLKEYRRLLG